jgi:serine/threonine protein kinase
VDHSDLDDPSVETHFLVMPLAANGDADRRLALFKSDVGNVIRVSVQIAEALQAAHDKNIIHRDVKPANILFPNESLSIWLADFGICHAEDQAEKTPAGEIVGPRRFAAPEVEEGNSGEVTPAADVYSLGQTIFYLLSGGRTFHREDVFNVAHNPFFQSGQRATMLRSLLASMVAPIASRILDMRQVLGSLSKIETWENQATLSPLGEDGLAAIGALNIAVQEAQRRTREIAAKEESRQQSLAAAAEGLASDLAIQCRLLAERLTAGGALSSSATDSPMKFDVVLNQRKFRQMSGSAVTIKRATDTRVTHTLVFGVMKIIESEIKTEVNATEVIVMPIHIVSAPGQPTAYGVIAEGKRVPMRLTDGTLVLAVRLSSIATVPLGEIRVPAEVWFERADEVRLFFAKTVTDVLKQLADSENRRGTE